MKTMLVVPAYNEEKNIVDVVTKMKRFIDIENIVVVDDGSSDRTYKRIREAGFTALKHPINIGKGGALKTGCDYAVKEGADKIICIDSDGQHDPKHIPGIEKELDNVDIVYTYRQHKKKMPFILKIGNFAIKKIGYLLHHIDVKDPLCGYRGFTADAYKKIRWMSTGYAVENEMVFNMKSKNLKFSEIPIETIYKDEYKGTSMLDGMMIGLNMIWWRFTKK